MNVVFHRFDPENMDSEVIARIEDGQITEGRDTLDRLGADLSMSERELTDRFDGPRVFADIQGGDGGSFDSASERSNADSVTFSRIEHSWVPYRGPLGSNGWVNVPSGCVKYQKSRPDDVETMNVFTDFERTATDSVLASDMSAVKSVCEEHVDVVKEKEGVEPIGVVQATMKHLQRMHTESPSEGITAHESVVDFLGKLRDIDADISKGVTTRESISLDIDGGVVGKDTRLYLLDATETPTDATLKRDPCGNPYVVVGDIPPSNLNKSVDEEGADPFMPALEVSEIYRVWVDSPDDVPEDHDTRSTGGKSYYEIDLRDPAFVDLSKHRVDIENAEVRSEKASISKRDVQAVAVDTTEWMEKINAGELHPRNAKSPISLLYGYRHMAEGAVTKRQYRNEFDRRGINRMERVVKARETVVKKSLVSDSETLNVESESNGYILLS